MAEKNKEYASMYFGFTSGAFADTVFNIGNESIAASLKKFRKEMQQKCTPGNALRFDKAFQTLTVQTETRGMQLNDKLKFVLESRVFNIPPHILVETDFPQQEMKGVDKDAFEQDLDQKIEETEKKILSSEYARQKLERSIAENEKIVLEFEELLRQNQEQKEHAAAFGAEVKRVISSFEETASLLPQT